MLAWIFDDIKNSTVFKIEENKAAGFLELQKANIRWYLSIDKNDLPKIALTEGKSTYRSITIDNNELEFSGGFTSLHTVSYKNILAGKGYRINEARNCIEIAYKIRNQKPIGLNGDYHPLLM